jgi:hypothetical protein
MLWFNNAAKGPTTLEKLKELLAAKKISSESLVIEASKFQAKSPSENVWVKLGEVLGSIPEATTPILVVESQPARISQPIRNSNLFVLWFNNAAKGPTTLEKLQELLAAKKISMESFVIEASTFQTESPSDNKWLTLREVLGEMPATKSDSSVSASQPQESSASESQAQESSASESQAQESRMSSETNSTLQNRNNSDPHETHFSSLMRALKALAICIATIWALVVFVNYIRTPTATIKVRQFSLPRLSYESTSLRNRWSYGPQTNRDVAMALLERSDTELEIQAKAEFDGDAKNAREHAQRAADYLMAAKVFYSTGKYPPGFDSDLATK